MCYICYILIQLIYNTIRDCRDELSDINLESLVNVITVTLNMSLPFVHTARRFNRLSKATNVEWVVLLRGWRSRNTVSVGEPADGSIARISYVNSLIYITKQHPIFCHADAWYFKTNSRNIWRIRRKRIVKLVLMCYNNKAFISQTSSNLLLTLTGFRKEVAT